MKINPWFLVTLLIGAAFAGYLVKDRPNQIIFNVTYIEPSNLKDFQTRAELEDYLAKDDTSEFTYTSYFDCKEFGKRLSHYAGRNGYHIAMLWDEHQKSNNTHIYNLAYVINEGRYYVIEPQTDELVWSWRKQPTSFDEIP